MKADVNRIGAPSKRNSRWKPTLVGPRGRRTDRRVAERKLPRENSGNSTESSGTKIVPIRFGVAPKASKVLAMTLRLGPKGNSYVDVTDSQAAGAIEILGPNQDR